MAQRLLHRLLFTIFFWQSQWHSDYYTDFFWQSFSTISMAQLVPYSFCWKPWYLKSQWHNDNYIDFLRQTFLTIPIAQRLLHRLFCQSFFDNPNGTATVTQTFFGNFFWQSQWHSDCCTDFFCQSFLTIPMAQRLLHRLFLAISFDNPNGTAASNRKPKSNQI